MMKFPYLMKKLKAYCICNFSKIWTGFQIWNIKYVLPEIRKKHCCIFLFVTITVYPVVKTMRINT